MGDQVERLSELNASQLLYEPVILQSLPVGIKARVASEELFLEGLGEVELLTRADLIGKAVWEYDLVTVNN